MNQKKAKLLRKLMGIKKPTPEEYRGRLDNGQEVNTQLQVYRYAKKRYKTGDTELIAHLRNLQKLHRQTSLPDR